MVTQLSETYLAEPARLRLVADYLRHEACKLHGNLYTAERESVIRKTSEWHAALLDCLRERLSGLSSVEEKRSETVRFLESIAIDERWALFHAVSWGCLTKKLENCVGHPSFRWAREQWRLCEMEFESTKDLGPLHAWTGTNLPSFCEAVDFLRPRGSSDQKPHSLDDPLIGRQHGQRIRIHDGNGRLLSYAYAALAGRIPESKLIDIWVGYSREPYPEEVNAYEHACRTVFAETDNATWQ